MKHYDWIVIGGGITGSALSYELAKKGRQVLLLEKDPIINNATLYSYGGLAYWSGNTELTRKLCQEGIEIQRNLSQELAADTEFQELDLLLTIDLEENPENLVKFYNQFAINPELLTVEEAGKLEPLLNPKAISGVLRFSHGHIHPEKTNRAYQQAFLRLGGELKIQTAISLLRQGNKIQGVTTSEENYYADNTVVCAGGLSRCFLREAGIPVQVYFSHAQVIKIPPVEIKLRTLVMPATQNRFQLEAKATQPHLESLWDNPNQNLVAASLDAGAIQFLDGSIYLGQISQIITDSNAIIDVEKNEARIRQEVAKILPALANLPGTLHHCLVAFSPNSLPWVGAIPSLTGIHLFSGFTSTLVFAPPLARHFANWVTGGDDEIFPLLGNN
jgi:glycine/D-amino acid oxidase-like deaminating enzyme